MNTHSFSSRGLRFARGLLTWGPQRRTIRLVARTLSQWVAICKALAHPARQRLLALLAERELCVCQMVVILQLAFSTVSTHLAALRRAGLLTERKTGRWVFYSLAPLDEELAKVTEPLLASLASDPRVQQDRALAERVCAVALEDLSAQATASRKLPLPTLP